ncbi:MAG: hypothetical protein RR367_06330, partial [Clostridia bacterium]
LERPCRSVRLATPPILGLHKNKPLQGRDPLTNAHHCIGLRKVVLIMGDKNPKKMPKQKKEAAKPVVAPQSSPAPAQAKADKKQK